MLQSDVFAPPKAPVADQPRPLGSPVKAVFLGLLTDIGGGFALNIAFGIFGAAYLAMKGISAHDARSTIMTVASSTWFTVVNMALGSATSVLSGYVCARISGRRDYKLGVIQGVLSMAIGLSLSYKMYSLAANVGLSCLTIGCVLLGTHLGRARAGRV